MTEADRNRPENTADNNAPWWEQYARERDAAVQAYDRLKPTRWNASGLDRW